MKKDYKVQKSMKSKEQRDENQKEDCKEKCNSSVKIEEIKAINEAKDGDIFFASSLDSVHVVAIDEFVKHDWIIEFEASFHVTLNKDWFNIYDVA